MPTFMHRLTTQKALAAALAVIAATSALVMSPLDAFADTPKDAVCSGLNLTGGSGCGDAGAQVQHVIAVAVNLLSFAVGVAAVIMIIVAGMRFITSGGDAAKVASAKNAIIYALVGIVIVVLSQAIVHFVFSSLA